MKPLLQKYGAHLMSGHDHCLEHIEEKGVHYFVSGIGSECCYEGSNLGGVADGNSQYYLLTVPNTHNACEPRMSVLFLELDPHACTVLLVLYSSLF